jgi:3-oxoacyl-[acyl-carrier protein] reductase
MCARNKEELDAACKAVAGESCSRAIAVACDLSTAEAISEIRRTLEANQLEIDVLISNVGGPKPGTVTELSEADWETGLDLLFRSTLRLYGLVLPNMQRKKWGRIINILSTVAIEPAPILAISSVLRSALATYSKLLSRAVAGDGITVNSIMPGGFLTARTEALEKEIAAREALPIEAVRERVASKIPVGRMLSTDELGAFVSYLASDNAGGVTGTLLPFDGGQMITV